MNELLRAVMLMILCSLILGCDENARVARVAEQAAERQARQNDEMARVTRESAEAARRLVEADAQVRQEFLASQQDLQAQQAEVGRQRDRLETERREIAEARCWDAVVGSAIGHAALLLACLLPLIAAVRLLRIARDESSGEAELAELLTRELVADAPVLLPPPQKSPAAAIGCDRPPRGPAEPDGPPAVLVPDREQPLDPPW